MTQNRNISISDFDYPLPPERIAAHPLEQRDSCKLLYLNNKGEISEHIFTALPGLLPPDSLLVCNNTRVINARLLFRKGPDGQGALIEIFCLEPVLPTDYALAFSSTGPCRWLCFVGNSKKWKEGSLQMPLTVDGRGVILTATRIDKVANASVVEFSWREIKSDWSDESDKSDWSDRSDKSDKSDKSDRSDRSDKSDLTWAQIIETAGVIPIPPYLNRETEDADKTDYQTIYSRINGSVAAPTAGLHFTPEVLQAISDRGIPCRELTLHVGAGTFQPVKEDDVANHLMHSEFISVPLPLIEELASTPRRVYAVGTTSVRTLESLYHIGCLIHHGQWTGEVPQWYPYSPDHPNLSLQQALTEVAQHLRQAGLSQLLASTRIIIAPGYQYRVVQGMLTNFHQPKSTLLLLVSAFIGQAWHQAYDYALAHGFRFLSYGDACLFEKIEQNP